MSANRVNGAQPPPRHPVPTYHVIRVQKEGAVDLTILANTVFGVACHYVLSDEGGYGETRVCTQHEGECKIHDEKDEWLGFLPVWWHNHNKKAILRLAPKEYEALSATLGIDLTWALVRVKIKPVNNGQGKRIAVEKVSEHMPVANVGPFSMERTICLTLRCSHIPRQTPADPPADEEVRGL